MDDLREKISTRIAQHLDTLYPDFNFCDMKLQSGVKPPRFMISFLDAYVEPRITTAGIFLTLSLELLFDPGEDSELLNTVYLPTLLALQEIPDGEHLYRPVIGTLKGHKNESEGVLQFYFDLRVSLNPPVDDKDRIRQLFVDTEVEELHE